MGEHKEDAHLALATLEKIAEEFPSGVSASDVAKTLPLVPNVDVFVEGVKTALVDSLTSTLRDVWEDYKICEKLRGIKECCCDQEAICENVHNSIQVKHMKKQKKALEANLTKMKEENSKLEELCMEKVEKMRKHMQDVIVYLNSGN